MIGEPKSAKIAAQAALVEHANEIRRLGRRAIEDIVAIGLHLIEAKKLCGHGNWLRWLDREFGWKEQSARNFMNVAEMAAKTPTVGDLNIDCRALYLLAAPSTPAEVVAAVVARGRAGETITHRTVVEAVHYVEPAPIRPTVYYAPPDQPKPESRTIAYVSGEAEDPARARIRLAAAEVLRSLRASASALVGHQAGAVVAALTDDEQRQLREDIAAIEGLKAALDKTNVVRFPDRPN